MAGGPAYPSGHTNTSALVAALICVAAACAMQGRSRLVVWTIAVLWAILVGLTRIYLGVHWPTDVLAGWLLAATLVTTAVLLAEALTDRHEPTRVGRDQPPSTAGETGE